MTFNPDKQPAGDGLLMAVGSGLLVVACCAEPALIAGGALAGIGGLCPTPWVMAAGVLLVIGAVLAIPRQHQRDDCRAPDPSRNKIHAGHAPGEDH